MDRGTGKKIVWGLGLSLTAAVGAAFAQAQPPKPATAVPPPDAKAIAFFESRIRPLLAAECFACHSEKNIQGGLRVDTAEHFFKGGALGKPVTPGHPEMSLLIEAVSYTKDLKMPPKGKLKPQQIADLTAWVKMGAPWPNFKATPPASTEGGPLFTDEQRKFWAFQPVKDYPAPAVKNRAWVQNPVDAFVLAKLEAKGLKPAARADKRTLIRRVTFDLTGLPPTPQEIDAFLSDASPNAWEKVIDRLLATDAYGERWGRHWLDIARYADSNGLDENTAFGNAWRYRDYVVRSFNQDKPYDQFIREQIAGDLLPASQDDRVNANRLTATGYLVLGPKVLAEPDKDKMVMDIVDEQIDTMGKGILGLTLGCARCHDHKFDPIPTKDYYSLAGIFKSTRTMQSLATVAKAFERPIADKDAQERAREYQVKVDAKQDELRTATAKADAEVSTAIVKEIPKYLLLGLQADVQPLRLAGEPDLKRPGAVDLQAEKFVKGDVAVNTTSYGQGIGIIESAGRSRAFTEYEVQVPAAGEYEVWVRYASGEPRPVRLLLGGRMLKPDAAARATGGFNPQNQVWEAQLVASLEPGRHVLRIEQASGSLPHIDRIAVVPPAPATPASAGPRPRSAKAADLARTAGLNAEVLRQSASALLGGGPDPVWEPWHLLAAIPDAEFAARAPKLIAEWKSSGKMKSWNRLVAALFEGPAPKSLAEVAEGYGRLFAQANEAWNRQAANARKPRTRLGNPDLDAFREELFSGVFGLGKLERFYPQAVAAQIAALKKEVEALQKNAPEPSAMVLAVEEAQQIGNVKVHIRGNTLTLGDEAPRQFPQIIAGEKQAPVPSDRSGRLELAEWLTSPANPLTARVMVNRIWEHHFGEGIVRSPDNFGKLGERPTHPELLDWLAKRFMEKGWSLKAMHRLILTSNAYQMSTAHDAKAALADPENRLLWHFKRRRLEVEAIRDSMLAVSDNLDRSMGGSLLKTKNFDYVTNDQSGNGAQYDSPRRSIYLPVIRNAVFDVFQVFDFVEPSFPNGQRATTTVAPQALFMLNGQFVLQQSEALAERVLAQPGSDADRIKSAFLLAFGRPATAQEVTEAEAYLKTYAGRLAPQVPEAEKRSALAWRSYCQILFASNEFVIVN